MGGKYGRVLFLKEYASYIKDSMINELTSLNRSLMLSIDIIPVPTDEAVREMQNRLLGVETNVTNWQRRQNGRTPTITFLPLYLTIWSSSARRPVRCWTISPPATSG